MLEAGQAIAVPYHQKAARCEHAMQSGNQLGLGVLGKVNEHITTENKMKLCRQGVGFLEQINSFNFDMVKNFWLDPAFAFIDIAAPLEVALQKLRLG